MNDESSPGTDSVKDTGRRSPQVPRQAMHVEHHGETRADPYAWLRDDNWQAVLADPAQLRDDIREQLQAENTYYEAVTGELGGLCERLLAEMRGRIREDDSSVPAADGPWAYFVRYREGGEYPVFCRRSAEGGEEQVLFDGDRERETAGSAFFDVAEVEHSPDHRLVACGVDTVGSELFTLRVRDLDSGAELEDRVERTGGVVVWSADSASFFYVERDEQQRPRRIRLHVLGDDPADDRLVYAEPDPGFFVDVDKSLSGEYVFITASNHVCSDVRFVRAERPEAEPTLIAPRLGEELYAAEHRGDHFYLHTNAGGATDFKIARAPVDAPGRDNWEDWLGHEPGTLVEDFVAFRDYLVRLERRRARPRIVVSDYARNEHAIEFPAAAYSLQLSPGYAFATEYMRYLYASPSQPAQTFDYDMRTRSRELLKTREVPSGHDPDDYAVERVDAPAPDGARVPVTILRRHDTPLDGTAPLLLEAYGSYGLHLPDDFSSHVLSLVDRGFVHAVAHVRGGSACGWQWYLDGKLENKQNTFDDCIAAAERLIAEAYTGRGRIVVYGGSAGGLVVGAVLNQRPDLFGAGLGAVPFVDILNTMSDPDLPLTPPEWPEWGNPVQDPEAYRRIRAYSPYDNIRDDVDYPPVMATAGLADFRVTYWEPAKWIARLRAEARGGPFVLRVNLDAGHAGSAARFERLEEIAHLYAFALWAVDYHQVEPR